jgi:hypothetical protein
MEKKLTNIKIMTRRDRIVGELPDEEIIKKIDETNQCIFLLTENCYSTETQMAADECMENVLKRSNKRAAILLYKQEVKKDQEKIFKILAEHFVVHIVYGEGDWLNELAQTITGKLT